MINDYVAKPQFMFNISVSKVPLALVCFALCSVHGMLVSYSELKSIHRAEAQAGLLEYIPCRECTLKPTLDGVMDKGWCGLSCYGTFSSVRCSRGPARQ